MNVLLRYLTLATACVLATACGSSTEPAVVVTPVKATAATPLTAAKAKAVAKAGVLTAADFPGYTVSRAAMTADLARELAAFTRCSGTRLGPYLVRNFGNDFTRNGTLINSSVDVAKTAAQAGKELTALTSAKGRQCVLAAVKPGTERDGVRIVSAKITPLSVVVPDADKSFGYVLELGVTKNGRSGQYVAWQLGSTVGQAQISIAVRVGAELYTVKDSVGLLTAAVARTRAAR